MFRFADDNMNGYVEPHVYEFIFFLCIWRHNTSEVLPFQIDKSILNVKTTLKSNERTTELFPCVSSTSIYPFACVVFFHFSY